MKLNQLSFKRYSLASDGTVWQFTEEKVMMTTKEESKNITNSL